MNKMIQSLRCTLCKKTYEPGLFLTCPSCGEQGILDVVYDFQALGKFVDKPYFEKNKMLNMFRYHPLLPIAINNVDQMLSVGWTPLYQANRLHKTLGIKRLYIKDEGQNPSGSLKDRASAVAVLLAIESGFDTVACSSTGNAASSLAAHASRMGLKSVIFVPKRAPIGKVNQLSIYGADVIMVNGDYKETFQLSKAAIEHYGWYNRNAGINPYLVEGKKTVAYEIAEQLDFKPTDWVVVSVGDGCTVAGVYQGFCEFKKLGLINKLPRILGVQSEGCDPFVKAFSNNNPLQEQEENTLADSISVGIPRNPIKAMRAIRQSRGHLISVSDTSILNAMVMLGHHEGIFGEPAATASLAGLKKAVEKGIILSGETVTIINTGNGLKAPKNAEKAIAPPPMLEPSLQALKNHFKEKENEHV
ncbi:MAG: threonine synthase [Acholeplasmataceae bacterium]|nr:threonine synthase [Acholeplasmataceae bacterium]